MLHEIFKGMDNAAELINENFENGSIVESGETENGEYMALGNGWQICWHSIEFSTSDVAVNASTEKEWRYPKSFPTRPLVIPSSDTSTGFTVNAGNYKTSTRNTTEARTQVVLSHLGLNNELSRNDVFLIAIGRWK